MAQKQALIVGLGQLGVALARSLAASNVDVLAIDRRPEAVQAIAPVVAQALCFDAMDEAALARTAPDKRDVCMCTIGDESREGAIMVTALLRKLGAPRVIARAGDDLLERILYLVGAHDVVNPERAFGQRLATRLLYEGIVEVVPLGGELVMTELKTPTPLVGHRLAELALPTRFGITLLGIRRHGSDGKTHVERPEPDTVLAEGDLMIVVSAPGATESLVEKLSS